jgi:hypothetical protein
MSDTMGEDEITTEYGRVDLDSRPPPPVLEEKAGGAEVDEAAGVKEPLKEEKKEVHELKDTLHQSDEESEVGEMEEKQHKAPSVASSVRSTLRARAVAAVKRKALMFLYGDMIRAQTATEMQRLIRGFLDRKRVNRMRIEYTAAAIKIQRVYRGYRTKCMFQAFMRYRHKCAHCLTRSLRLYVYRLRRYRQWLLMGA